jgi:hypothetical protein
MGTLTNTRRRIIWDRRGRGRMIPGIWSQAGDTIIAPSAKNCSAARVFLSIVELTAVALPHTGFDHTVVARGLVLYVFQQEANPLLEVRLVLAG